MCGEFLIGNKNCEVKDKSKKKTIAPIVKVMIHLKSEWFPINKP
jgi:hypothetical protein